MSKDHDLWPADHGPWIAHDLATFVPPPPRPSNPFDHIPPQELFAGFYGMIGLVLNTFEVPPQPGVVNLK
ncbi:MAG: hypothetical protein WB689_23220, partial [Xanthobacteraceae bacterium]